jgi:hypothetical protein
VKLTATEMRIHGPKNILSLILFLLGFFSCEKAAVTNQATADVFIKSIAFQGDTLYGVAHSVFSYNRINQVSVKIPSGDTLLLPSQIDNGISFYKDPSLNSGDFNVAPPSTGIYSYRITFKDKSQTTLSNTLGANYLLPARIDSLGRSADGRYLVLKWNPVNEAQGYQIRIVKGKDEVISAKTYFQLNSLRVQFPISSFNSFLPGTFTVELDAFLFESAAHQQLQAMSVAKDSIQLQ